MTQPRETILRAYAEWTALSALRSGAPIKSRGDIYPLLRNGLFAQLEDRALGQVSAGEFDVWHESACAAIAVREARLQVGWAAKLLNIYLKSNAYVGGAGRPGLAAVLHPPIDAGLWLGLRRRFADRQDILELTHCVTRIKDIADYPCYRRIITGCRLAATALGCTLLEVEQLWAGTEIAGEVSSLALHLHPGQGHA